MWTGDGDAEKDGTYIRQIKQGNLLSLSKWLKSENGKKLKKEYGKNVWKRITYHTFSPLIEFIFFIIAIRNFFVSYG